MSRISIAPARSLGTVDRKIFGGFVEHLGRCIYGGLYQARARGVARLDPRCGVRPGDRITLRADTARLYFFDPATGDAAGWPSTQDMRSAAATASAAATGPRAP